ncbi:dynamin family protein [Actinacidiphila bryophytorum]|uniref:dynamin family protein n=1 Tax=Actinacidiphila bryophytorum TaxID=1436133 RepID=UPI002176C89C|nr:dynamin family protein [Actinacidiphila bryophytorum]UWE13861.1 50S ribosome-binding GTPase [Actinacidiphila bryophytorum]
MEALARLAVGGGAHRAVARVGERLAEPALRLAVAGRLNAGKSTLVNALLGGAVAATDATECTTVVTWYRHAERSSVQVLTRGGERYELPYGGSVVLDRDAGEIAEVTVSIPVDVLHRRYLVVDTPGLDSMSRLDELSTAALRQADVLLYVMPHPGERDREALTAFRSATRGARMSAYNAVGVLSRIDQLGGGPPDPWPGARRVATRYAESLRTLLSDVLPVAGLVAQATAGGAVTEADARAVAELAACCPPGERRPLLARKETLLAADLPVPPAARERLHRLLGLFGLREALALADSGVRGAPALVAGLRRGCGVEALLSALDQRFVRHADVLRSDAALAALDRIGWASAPPAERAALAALRSGWPPYGVTRGCCARSCQGCSATPGPSGFRSAPRPSTSCWPSRSARTTRPGSGCRPGRGR